MHLDLEINLSEDSNAEIAEKSISLLRQINCFIYRGLEAFLLRFITLQKRFLSS